MHSLIYVSTVADGVKREDVDALADAAATNNALAGVTGMLAYNGQHFMQLLEGRRDVIDELIEKVSLDARHRDLAIIRREDKTTRECPDWSMRTFVVPCTKAGSAKELTESLPKEFRPETKMLFTSFGSMVRNTAGA
ncbi:BLUF domain-containing protein [Pontixanthobacter sp. CEM42]|uniref:BLUF domain-containing protein n=1 Tax=Pontixanthobacter sp. CEM42 TaxID=2792077 RepID=UPI001AE0754F|nr:BLUF domain-containing protein [Pontixanthobacter sp. CEM42]